jgi:hypothetical protein
VDGLTRDDGTVPSGRIDVGADGAQLGEERPGVDGPGGGVAPRRPHDELVQAGRHAVDDLTGRRDVLVHVPEGDRQRAVGGVRRRARQQLPEQDPGRVDVGARVGAAVLDLLGREVGHRADDHAGGGREGAGLERPCQSEVGDLDPAVGRQQDVLGLDVAVHQPRGVRGGEGDEHRFDEVERPGGRQGALLVQHVAQRAARDELHDEVRGAGARVGALVVDGDDLGARQPGGRAGLPGEALDEVGVLRERRPHGLHGDRPVEPGVGGGVDGGHATAGDDALEPVATVEQSTEQAVRGGRPAPGSTAVHGRVHDPDHRSARPDGGSGAAPAGRRATRSRSARAAR